MTNQHVITRDQSANAVTALRSDLEKMETQFRFALPAHIPPARFMRVVMTAVQNNPKLLKCTRQSFFNACMRCAQDGLLPDGREAALVPFAEDEDGKNKSDLAQYLPMIAGIRKKVRNSGLLRDWNVQVVQEGDQFDYQLGDNPFIRHKPSPTGGRARPVLFAYSIATYPDGTMSREVMNIDQIKDIQSKSKARRGPWSDPIFYPEMCRKTVAKLHAKQLPMSTDLDTVMRRDEELYDFRGERERSAAIPDQKPPPSVAAALDTFGNDFDEPIAAPMIADDKPASSAPSTQPPYAEGEHGGAQESEADSPAAAAATENAVDVRAVAYRRGQEARAAGQQRKAVPPEYREPGRLEESREWQRGWDEAPKTGASGPGSAPMLALATLAFLCASLMPAILYLNA